MVKEAKEKRLVTYRRRGKGVCSEFVQNECVIEGLVSWRSVGKRSATHPCIMNRSLKWCGKEREVSEKTRWDDLVARSSHGNGEGA